MAMAKASACTTSRPRAPGAMLVACAAGEHVGSLSGGVMMAMTALITLVN